MRTTNQNSFNSNGFFKLKDLNYLQNQRIAGKCVAECLSSLQDKVNNKTPLTTKELSRHAEYIIEKYNCSPTFKGYKGFPEAVCISVNNCLVHGIPNDYVLQEGDVVSFDLGATYKEAIADSALTCIYGTPKLERHVELVKATQTSLDKSIEAIKTGNNIGCIGHTIYKYARETKFSVVTNYGGHGICTQNGIGIPHAAPFISNKAELNEGIRIQPGLVIAIEPLFVVGSSNQTKTDKDGWSVYTEDIGSHHEHSIFVHNDSVEILTWRENESYFKSNRVYFNQTAT